MKQIPQDFLKQFESQLLSKGISPTEHPAFKKWMSCYISAVSTGLPIPKLGQRSSNTAAVAFKNVRVPKENVLAEPGKGFILAIQTFSRTRGIIGAFVVG